MNLTDNVIYDIIKFAAEISPCFFDAHEFYGTVPHKGGVFLKNKQKLFRDGFLPVRSFITPAIKLLYAVIASPILIHAGESIIREEKLYEWLRSDSGDFAFWISSIAVFLVIATISLITTKLSIGIGSVGILSVLAHGVHYFKLELRGEPFFPWDIFQINEATNIVSDITIEFTDEIWQAIIYTSALLFGAILIDIFFRYPRSAKYYFRLAAGVVTIVSLYFFTTGVIWNTYLMSKHGIQLVLFDEVNSYDTGGFLVTFLQNAENMIVDPPEDYNSKNISDITDGYENQDGKTPNIICIMSEAFVNPDQWTSIGFSEEITPVIESVSDKCLTGNVLTPSYGGGTSISEYEVLTGNSASFLPQGSVPYMQYVTSKTDSYASFLKELGYSTVAIHPYTPSFWCRNKAYPLMGFDKFLSQDDFENPEKPRYYISDMDLTEKIISEYEAAKDNGPFFAFCVSMQNHASYTGSDYGGNLVELDNGDYSGFDESILGSLRSYATGAQLADEALGVLIDYLEKEESDTVILFFGDHQPYIGPVDLNDLGLTSPDYSNAMNLKLTYSTPYIIWNNFGAETADTADLSMYQLLPYMTEKLGLARPAYFEYLSDMRNTLSGRTNLVALNPDGTPVADMTSEQNTAVKNHWLVQYDMMFGKKYVKLW